MWGKVRDVIINLQEMRCAYLIKIIYEVLLTGL